MPTTMALKSSAKKDVLPASTASVPAAASRTRAMLLLGLLLSVAAVAASGYVLARRAAMPVPASDNVVGYQDVAANAMKYVQALQTGQYQQALLQLDWVQERLDHVRATQGSAVAENEALSTLVTQLANADRTQAVVREEGIEDQYIFVPRAQVDFSGADAGRGDLERPTAGRAWLRVSFPEPAIAPKSIDGRSIKAMTVGVNVAADGRILKSEIIGNLEIDEFSIGYF